MRSRTLLCDVVLFAFGSWLGAAAGLLLVVFAQVPFYERGPVYAARLVLYASCVLWFALTVLGGAGGLIISRHLRARQ
jgi:hypothetical protein